MDNEIDPLPPIIENNVKKKTISFMFNCNSRDKKVLDILCCESKNIYNFSIFCIHFYSSFKSHIYIELDVILHKILLDSIDSIIINEHIDLSDIKENVSIDEHVKTNLFNKYLDILIDHYFIIYQSNKKKLDEINKSFFIFIVNFLKDLEITNDNYFLLKQEIKNQLINTIIFEEKFKQIFFDDIIDNIFHSFYIKHYNKLTQEIKQHLPMSSSNDVFKKQVLSGKIIENKKSKDYKTGLIKKLNIKSTGFTNQAIITRLVHKKLIDCKLTYDLIHETISKAFQNYSSFYALKAKGIKASIPKYLKYDQKFNIFFTYKMFSKKPDFFELNVGKYIGENYIDITQNKKISRIDNKLFIETKYVNKINKKIKKSENYIVNNDFYVNKKNKHIFNASHIYIKNFDKLCENIKLITIIPLYNGKKYKISMTYDKKIEKIIQNEELTNINQYLSIDLGMKNLMVLFDPNGSQFIINGKFINSMNYEIDQLIDQKKSEIKKNISNKIAKLLIKKENKINNYFNLITKWLYNKYKDKKKIIIGYNKGWKTGVNMGSKTDRKFYEIPYRKLLNKIRDKFNKDQIIEVNESYTSKTDGLALEEVCKHEVYLGRRLRRGLFSSSVHKYINADMNGAINIMRKYVKQRNEITLTQEIEEKIRTINVCNPKKVNVFYEVLRNQ